MATPPELSSLGNPPDSVIPRRMPIPGHCHPSARNEPVIVLRPLVRAEDLPCCFVKDSGQAARAK